MYNEQRGKYPGLQFTTDNVILPDLEKLFEVCGQLIFISEIDKREIMFWQCFNIQDNKVEIITEAVEAVKNQWRVYAVTPDEKERLVWLRKICSLLDTRKLANPAQLIIPGFVFWDAEAGVYSPMQGYIKGYIK
jgi:hypothetical protein